MSMSIIFMQHLLFGIKSTVAKTNLCKELKLMDEQFQAHEKKV